MKLYLLLLHFLVLPHLAQAANTFTDTAPTNRKEWLKALEITDTQKEKILQMFNEDKQFQRQKKH